MGVNHDSNSDGLMDIFIANDTERNFLFIHERGNGTFEDSSPYGVPGTSIGLRRFSAGEAGGHNKPGTLRTKDAALARME